MLCISTRMVQQKWQGALTVPFHGMDVTVAESRILDVDEDLARTGLLDGDLLIRWLWKMLVGTRYY